jgi:lipopolysaccharide/colanic/teichoic acid biosynthesis glycosyltransferase
MLNIAHESLGRARPGAMVTRDGVLWRVMEVAVATALLVVVAPLCAAIAVAIFIDGGGSVFFAQPRIGRYGRPFRILKFRTMTPAAGTARVSATPFDQLPDHPRLTRVGRVLRRTHLDELPQLLNVIAGKMSLVGPGGGRACNPDLARAPPASARPDGRVAAPAIVAEDRR